ncbi:MAG: DUF485 domain-containing protein [Deltaproteobacteria bacterium]|nr:DUF485 domain-containing protein [Deltaproteobacteria bacterium]
MHAANTFAYHGTRGSRAARERACTSTRRSRARAFQLLGAPFEFSCILAKSYQNRLTAPGGDDTQPAVARDELRPPPDIEAPEGRLHALARERARVAWTLTAAVVLVYFGFIASVAFARGALGALVAPGLSVGILAGALVIVVSWLLTWVYVGWANRRYDPVLRSLQSERSAQAARTAGPRSAPT